MKKCPKCEMIVDAEYECPFCHTTLTYEPIVNTDREKYVFNKYLVTHILKNSWFALLCALTITVLYIVKRPPFNIYSVIPFIFLVPCLLGSIFSRHCVKWSSWAYTEEYAKFKIDYSNFMLGILSLIFAFIFARGGF